MATKNTDKVVRIKLETWKRVAQHADFTDTIDSVINKILDKLEKKSKPKGVVVSGPKCGICGDEMKPHDMVVKHVAEGRHIGFVHAHCAEDFAEELGVTKFKAKRLKDTKSK